MADTTDLARSVIAALNARDFAALSARVQEDVVLSGIGEGSDNGREALRDRFARYFQSSDETYADALVMSDAGSQAVAIRVTAHGKAAGGGAYSREKIVFLEVDEGAITRIALFNGS
ncbi:nuclear transport factor 2 family protein [Shinella oryzae]|uniref:Nuclear transport factor 2 family protein n=1 Tax=Shinella oryzae TaxID=2871820 RepID=A0ABY9K2L6_9HYPH|nr:nuclear transport factor 2 family protein [Shinella oryzae]WLS02815.1 nuclear transport factor 2 family protein [Shinella oryzae]